MYNCNVVAILKLVDQVAGKNTSQSSTYMDRMDHFPYKSDWAVDDDDSTCAETAVEGATWWKSDSENEYLVHTVVVKTGISFGCKFSLSTLAPRLALSVGLHWD